MAYVIVEPFISHEIGILVKTMLSLAIDETWAECGFET